MNVGHSSCSALSERSWEDVTFWEMRREPTWAGDPLRDGSSGKLRPRSRTTGPGWPGIRGGSRG